jgi:hypothetical protein
VPFKENAPNTSSEERTPLPLDSQAELVPPANRRALPERVANPWPGSRKRSGSPSSAPCAKLPRLGPLGQLQKEVDEIKSSVQAMLSKLETVQSDAAQSLFVAKEQWSAERQAWLADLDAVKQSNTESSRLAKEHFENAKATFVQKTELQTTELALVKKSELQALELTLVKKAELQASELALVKRAELQALESTLVKKIDVHGFAKTEDLCSLEQRLLAKLNAADATAEKWKHEWTGAVQELQGTLAKKSPGIGEPGYLALACETPEGMEPGLHEAMLCGAAARYFSYFAGIDVIKDGDLLGETMQLFPDLHPSHIILALKHLHRQVFKKPLNDEEDFV